MAIQFTDDDFKDGYWYYRPHKKFPPKGIFDPVQYKESDRVNICSPPFKSQISQTKLTKKWMDALPHLENVRILWVNVKTSQKLFECICQMTNIEALWIKWSGIKSLAALENMGNLEAFHLGSSTQVESIESLISLTKLKWLELENIKNINDISIIGECTQLIGLGIDGSMWTTQKINSLGPIGKLENLKYLSLTNLKSEDKSLKPLANLRNLKCLNIANRWHEDEVLAIRRANPGINMH